MTIDYRIRNIVIAAALAAAAVLLTVLYVSTSRKHDATQKQSVTVYTTTRSYPLGTAGSKVAGNLKAVTVSRAAMTPEAVTSPDQIRSLYTIGADLRGRAADAQAVRPADGAGRPLEAQRASSARCRSPATRTSCSPARSCPGDRVDVVANVKNPNDQNDVRIVIAPSQPARAPDREGAGRREDRAQHGTDDHAVILAVTDEQAQRLYYVMKNGEWSLQLRPVKKPKDSSAPDRDVRDGGQRRGEVTTIAPELERTTLGVVLTGSFDEGGELRAALDAPDSGFDVLGSGLDVEQLADAAS